MDWPWWRRAADWLHGRAYLVLTFDDGPADAATDAAILRVLARHRAHAIFFTVCKKAERDGQPIPERVKDLLADIAAGNVIGNHTYTHANLRKIAGSDLAREIVGCQATLERLTGQRVRWFRSPWGRFDPAVLTLIEQAGMQQMLWLDNAQDTLLLKPADIEQAITTRAGNGSIVLMHSRPTTAAALDGTLTKLERMGYRFVLPAAQIEASATK
jgi:peptidoglycan/xylan/chitin deacetylase (PgdA/CDA1 family)